MLTRLKNSPLVYSLYYAITGRGGNRLLWKKEYHRRRAAAERKVLEEADRDPALFRPNACPVCGGGSFRSIF